MASKSNLKVTEGGRTSPDGEAKVLVSACINGERIRFNQTNVEVNSPIWERWAEEGRLVPFCAELAAGFQVPRPPAEIVGGDGAAVLGGSATIREDTGIDVTDQFILGADMAVAYALEQGCVVAVLTDGSPSCGSSFIYDGLFGGVTREGTGVVAQALVGCGIRVFSEHQLDLADEFLQERG